LHEITLFNKGPNVVVKKVLLAIEDLEELGPLVPVIESRSLGAELQLRKLHERPWVEEDAAKVGPVPDRGW
jgi:hypothetical protein